MRNKILLIVFSVLLALGAAEIALRILGYTHWQSINEESAVKFEPAPPFLADSVLGYKLKTGPFKITQAGQSFTFTQNSKGYRLASADTTDELNDKRPKINIMGDSFTFGSGMDDSATYPWLMQLQLPEWRVENMGVPGYGVANVYAQMYHTLKADSTSIVFYAYFGQHNNRYERRVLKMMYGHTDLMGTVGYVVLNDQLQPHLNPYDYKLWWPSRFSALSNFLEEKYNRYADKKDDCEAVALRALERMNSWCYARGATFILVGMLNDEPTRKMLQQCSKLGIRTVDISVDLNDSRYSQMPYDGHPNSNANVVYAQRLYNYLLQQKLLIQYR